MKNELESLFKIEKFICEDNDDEVNFLKPITTVIKEKKCENSECPDITADLFGVEHTEIFPFFRSKKGDSFIRYNSLFNGNHRKIDLPFFEYTYLDLEIFTKKLGLEEESDFLKNIANAIDEKSKKFLKYTKFASNGLWLEMPEYISFFNNEISLFLLNEQIYNSINESPFDFFMFGNEKQTLIFSKNMFKINYKKLKSKNRFIINTIKEFPIFNIKVKKDIKNFKMIPYALLNPFRVSKDIYIFHLNKLYIEFGTNLNEPCTLKLYSDDYELEVISWERNENQFKIIFKNDIVEGTLVTDFENINNLNLSMHLEAGENFDVNRINYNDSIKQKVFAGIKRVVVYNNSKIEIFVAPPNFGSEVKPIYYRK